MRAVFVGSNIKGTPAMSAKKVFHDLKRILVVADVIGVQEFKWPWYWRVARVVLALGKTWSGSPGRFASAVNPIEGAQALFWKRAKFKRLRSYKRPAFDFSLPQGGIMAKRWMRAVLLQAKSDKFTAWFFSTHFAVDGDMSNSPRRNKRFVLQNIHNLDAVLTRLVKTGYPIMGEFDGNIHKNSEAYQPLMEVLNKHHATLHGEIGVEYAFTIPGKHGKFTHVEATTIPITQLFTDHEARVLTWVGERSTA